MQRAKTKNKQVFKLFRLLGIGLITIDPLRKSGGVKILLDLGEYKPRISNPDLGLSLGFGITSCRILARVDIDGFIT
jgi:hypothetical protein